MSQPAEPLSPVKRALIELREVRDRLAAAERIKTDPIAIVGVGLRLPGGVTTCDAFWDLLHRGGDAITEVPLERWDAASFHDSDPDASGKIVSRSGGFVDGVDAFDARFFGITPREAASLDPQQRMLLEVAWEALEHAGQPPDQLTGSSTGVFIGLGSTDYIGAELKFTAEDDIDAYLASGGVASVAAGRLSYVLGLSGPALTVDTACSSSLTAAHLAVQSLRLGECDLALAGGANLLLLPELSIACSRAHMLAPDGRCKTFDSRADGYVRSEGCGLVVLKRLSDATRDGDRVLAVIRGSALNQDGRSSGLTVPNGPAQEAVIRAALRNAGIQPARDISYVEAHGTGTALGDPVELRALGSVYREGRAPGVPLQVGSVKTNVGHLEAAAGITGLIKVVLALEHDEIPPHLHIQQPTTHVDWPQLALAVPTAPTAWARGPQPRVAGLSSFGFSGTNAHLIVSDPSAPMAVAAGQELARPVHVLTVSAKSDAALREAAGRLADHLDADADAAPLADICYTTNAGRSHFAERAAISATTVDDARAALRDLSAGRGNPGVARAGAPAKTPEVAFLFPGEGVHRIGMGRQLFDTQPAFRRALLECDAHLRPHLAVPLLSVLYPPEGVASPIDDPAYAAPALGAFEYTLAMLWQSWGVRPSFVLGRGVGEIAAACVAGVFDLEDALVMVARRAQSAARFAAGASSDVPMPKRRPASVGIVSPVTGRLSTVEELADETYGRGRDGSRADEALKWLADSGVGLCIEIGPAGTLTTVGREKFSAPGVQWLGSLDADGNDWRHLTDALRAVYVSGAAVDWAGFDAGYSRRKVALPSYPFQRERYWSPVVTPRVSATSTSTLAVSGLPGIAAGWTPLGRRLHSPAIGGVVYQSSIGLSEWPPLADYQVQGLPHVPASLFVEMALAAGRGQQLADLEFDQSLSISGRESRSLQMLLGSPGGSFSIVSAAVDTATDVTWVKHAEGTLSGESLPAAPALDLDAVRARCPLETDGEVFYAGLAARGVDAGLGVRTVRRTWSGAGEALGEVSAPLERPSQETLDIAMLEGCFHLVEAALPEPWRGQPYLISGLDRFVRREPFGPVVFGHVTLNQTEGDIPDVLHARLTIVDGTGRVVADASGVSFTRLHGEAEFSTPWLHELVWRPLVADAIPALPVAAIADSVEVATPKLAVENTLESYRLALDAVDRLATGYVVDAFRELGVTCAPGTHVSLSALLTSAGVLRRHEPLLRRLLWILSEQGYLRPAAGDAWEGRRALPPPADRAGDAALAARLPEFELTSRCGANLADALRGHADPLQLLFPDGSTALTERVYGESPAAQLFNGLLTEAVGSAARAAHGNRPLRVLEVGAGSGGTTAALLRVLPAGTRYTFTDISPLFLTQAEDRFADYSGMEYRPLDLERDVRAQGFDVHAFDLVVAVNVLHATADLAQTLERLRALLVPGGLMFVSEATAARPWLDVTFGLTEGWWRFVDRDLRPDHALLTRTGWIDLLESAGFSEAAALPARTEGVFATQALFVARATAVAAAVDTTPVGRWLVLADGAGIGAATIEALRARGECVVVRPEGVSDDLTADWRIDPRDPAAFERLVRAVTQDGAEPLAGCLHFWACDAPALAAGTAEAALAAAEEVCAATVFLAQALSAVPVSARIWMITCDAVATDGDARPRGVAQAPLWGLGRVLALEHPELWGGLIDLDPVDIDGSVARALTHVLSGDPEDQIAIRTGIRRGARLVRRSSVGVASVAVRSDASYLVIGGLGRIGIDVARFLVSRGARYLTLLSRRGSDGAEGAHLASLRAMGADVEVVQADVADAARMTSVFEAFGSTRPPLKGVIHAATTVGATKIRDLRAETLRSMLRPKVAGTHLLCDLCEGRELDFLVLFSSTAAAMGSVWLGHYAAANQFLDAYAAARRTDSCPVTSIAWGAWGNLEYESDEVRRAIEASGLRRMPVPDALAALGRLLRPVTPNVIVIDADWSAVKSAYEMRGARPLLSELVAPVAPQRSRRGDPSSDTLAERLKQLSPQAGRKLLGQRVLDEAARVLRLDSRELDAAQGLFELGMDSLMSLELRRRLEAVVGCTLPTTLMFNHPTVDAVVAYLADLLELERAVPVVSAVVPVAAAAEPAVAATSAAALDEMSEDELAALLATRLGEL